MQSEEVLKAFYCGVVIPFQLNMLPLAPPPLALGL